MTPPATDRTKRRTNPHLRSRLHDALRDAPAPAPRCPKTDADTTAYLAPATVAALDATRRGAADTATLFGLSTSRIKVRIRAASKAAGLEGVSSHGCRIGMAQDLARAKGIEMPAIMQAGGW